MALVVLLVFAATLLALSWKERSRDRSAAAFFADRRAYRPVILALGHSFQIFPVWMLIVVSAAAYNWGAAAIWIVPAVLAGYTLNWFWLGPRLSRIAADRGHRTLNQLLVSEMGERLRLPMLLSALIIAGTCLLMMLSAILPIAAEPIAASLSMGVEAVLVWGVLLATACAFLGGAGGVFAGDLVRSSLVVLLAVVLLIASFLTTDGFAGVWAQLAADRDTQGWFGERTGIVALAFCLGIVALGLGSFGMPPVIQRLLAVPAPAYARARIAALLWLLLVTSSALVAGWAGRFLSLGASAENVLDAVAGRILPGSGGIVTLLYGLVTISAMDTVLLVLVAGVSIDAWRRPEAVSPEWPRPAIIIAGGVTLATLLEFATPSFDRALLAWTLLGASLGPLVLVRLAGKRVRAGSAIGSMWAGYVLTLMFHFLPGAPGDFLERAFPFVAALGVALTGGERRQDPDRADRAHADHLREAASGPEST